MDNGVVGWCHPCKSRSSLLDTFLDPARHVLLVRDPALGSGEVSALGRFTDRATTGR